MGQKSFNFRFRPFTTEVFSAILGKLMIPFLWLETSLVFYLAKRFRTNTTIVYVLKIIRDCYVLRKLLRPINVKYHKFDFFWPHNSKAMACFYCDPFFVCNNKTFQKITNHSGVFRWTQFIYFEIKYFNSGTFNLVPFL